MNQDLNQQQHKFYLMEGLNWLDYVRFLVEVVAIAII